ncbi:hypothetical protein BB561_000211 [Smittium simulii]|uniref:Large ribosomal subunit protein mL46 n=1 Tax=Smittium simulii TaxID=133385 RepID=A0A2T9Z052_9FUNG|nr:hypothetical protein BB561_000211 [Smittium simulii]
MFIRILFNKKNALSIRKYSQKAESTGLKSLVSVGLVLQRNPIVTRERTAFEIEYEKYEDWIKYKSSVPFPKDFYLKKNSIAELNYLELERERKKINYFEATESVEKGKKKKDSVSEEELKKEEELKLALSKNLGSDENIFSRKAQLCSRVTEADKTGDITSLERKLDRTLYFLINKNKTTKEWRFPSKKVSADEVLNSAMMKCFIENCGSKAEIWSVGRGPIGHMIENNKDLNQETKTFFLKSHILSGKIVEKKSTEYAWLSKEEIEKMVAPEYYLGIKDMLSMI